jgi:glutamyl-tRNA synthetase
LITESLGWPSGDINHLLGRFDPAGLPRQPWIYRG